MISPVAHGCLSIVHTFEIKSTANFECSRLLYEAVFFLGSSSASGTRLSKFMASAGSLVSFGDRRFLHHHPPGVGIHRHFGAQGEGENRFQMTNCGIGPGRDAEGGNVVLQHRL